MNVFSKKKKKKSTEVNAALDSKHVVQSMSSKSNGTSFSHMNGWRVRFWVKNSLGACVTYQQQPQQRVTYPSTVSVNSDWAQTT